MRQARSNLSIIQRSAQPISIFGSDYGLALSNGNNDGQLGGSSGPMRGQSEPGKFKGDHLTAFSTDREPEAINLSESCSYD